MNCPKCHKPLGERLDGMLVCLDEKCTYPGILKRVVELLQKVQQPVKSA